MIREDPRHEAPAFRSECGVPRSTVIGAGLPLDEPSLLQPIDQIGHPATRDEDLPLQLAKQQRPHMIQCLEDAELGDRQVVSCDVRLRVSRNRGMRP